jgi:hypothetical protein
VWVFWISLLMIMKMRQKKTKWFILSNLKNQNGKVFYDKLTYIYLEMPNFSKTETELRSRLDQWLFFIKNPEDFQSIPAIFSNEIIFEKAFEKAELAKLDSLQWETYERSMKDFRDLKNTYDYACRPASNRNRHGTRNRKK